MTETGTFVPVGAAVRCESCHWAYRSQTGSKPHVLCTQRHNSSVTQLLHLLTEAHLEKLAATTNDAPVQVQHTMTLWEDDLEIRVLFIVEQVGDHLRQLGTLLDDHWLTVCSIVF